MPTAVPTPKPRSLRPAAGEARGATDDAHAQAAQELVRWQTLLGQVGREVAEPLSAALERVITLTTTGRIDHQGLRALRDDIERARTAGMACQQMSRLAGGRIRQSHERIHLTHTVQSVLAQRTRELQAHGLSLSQAMVPTEVNADASMLFALLNHLVDWWLACAQGPIALRLDVGNWPAHARLHCTFDAHAPDIASPGADVMLTRTSTLRWHLLEQTAQSMGLSCQRSVQAHQMQLTLTFPDTVSSPLADAGDDTAASSFGDSLNSQPLCGSHVLLIADRKAQRQAAREALRHTGITLDVCASVQEAVAFCRSGLPHAIVFTSDVRGPLLTRLLHQVRAALPDFILIEVTPEGRTFDTSSLQASGIARVGGEDIAHGLPSALVYELSRLA